MFYDYLDSLCAERGLTVSGLMEELKLSKSSPSRWKTKGYLPARDAAKKIADFFDISVSQLLSCGEDKPDKKEKPATDNSDELAGMRDEIMGFVQQLPREQLKIFLAQVKAVSQMPRE